MSSKYLQEKWAQAILSGQNMDYVDSLYEDYLHAKDSVPEDWQQYFSALPQTGNRDVSHRELVEYFKNLATQKVAPAASAQVCDKKVAVESLIDAYRKDGHWLAKIDPLGLMEPFKSSRLNLSNYELQDR